MMQAANDRKLEHLTHLRRLYWTRPRRVLVEREMRAARMIVLGNESPKQPSEVRLVEHDDVIEQLSA